MCLLPGVHHGDAEGASPRIRAGTQSRSHTVRISSKQQVKLPVQNFPDPLALAYVSHPQGGGRRWERLSSSGLALLFFNPLSKSSLLTGSLPPHRLFASSLRTSFCLSYHLFTSGAESFPAFLITVQQAFLGVWEETPLFPLLPLEGKGPKIVPLLKTLYSRNQFQAPMHDFINKLGPTGTQTKG